MNKKRFLFVKEIYRVSQKRCDLWRLEQNFTFFVQLSCMVFFQYFFLNLLIFFGTPMARKKIREPFFLSKSKVQKSKNVYRNYFYRNQKFYKDWTKESQKIRKIVIRKFAIFSSGLTFKEKLFKFCSSFLLSLF